MIKTKNYIRFLFYSTCIILWINTSAEQGGVWVKGSGTAFLTEDQTIAEAKNRARQKARLNAIETALGVKISAEKFMREIEVSRNNGEISQIDESYVDYIHESRLGRIVEEGIWQEDSEVITYPDGNEVIKYTSINRFYIKNEEGKSDPNFKLDLKLSRDEYRIGEAIVLNVVSSQNCYLTIFNVSANDSVYLIFPNSVESNNRQIANKKRNIPGYGYAFTAYLPEGKDLAAESIIAVATKDSLVFRDSEMVKPGLGFSEIWKSGLNDVWKWIAEIDADKRVEVIKSFNIINNK